MNTSLAREAHWPLGLYKDEGGYYLVQPESLSVDCEMFRRFNAAVGQNNGPSLLLDFVARGILQLSPSTARAVIDAWSGADRPERLLGTGTWLGFFTEVGFTFEGESAARPPVSLELFRGCTADLSFDEDSGEEYDSRFGMSWTSDIQIARRFAYDAISGRKEGAVYAATVEPEFLLAYIDKFGRNESEWVIDPRGLSDQSVRLLEQR